MATNLYDAAIQNSNGDVLPLTGQEDKWKITSITGLNPPQAQINTSTVAGMDGALFNSSKLQTRNIVITLYLQGDIEANRQELYFYIRTKEYCTFYFANTNRDVYIDGYVESVECNLFTNGELMQISIICPYPYFNALAEIINDISKIQPAFTFPFSIDSDAPIVFSYYNANYVGEIINNSDSEVGMIIRLSFSGSVSSITITNTDTNETLGLSYNFIEGDVVTINTNKGNKAITLIRNGQSSNIFSSIVPGSIFLQLKQGYNHFTFSVNSGASDSDVIAELIFSSMYRGI